MTERRRVAHGPMFLVAGLLVGIVLALVVSPFASSSPDGLEKVAAEEGFAESAAEHDLAGSPLADYAVDGVDDERLSTGLSGVVGVLLTFVIGVAIFATTRAFRSRRQPTGDEQHRTPA